MAQGKRTYSGAMYYSTTSSAYRYEEPEVLLPNEQERAVSRPKVKAEPRLNMKAVLSVCAAVLLAAGVAVLLIMRYERMSAASIRISRLRSQINTIETDIETLNIKLEYAMDINTAQLIARNSLGMDYPDAEQIKNIDSAGTTTSNQESALFGAMPTYAAVPLLTNEEQGGN